MNDSLKQGEYFIKHNDDLIKLSNKGFKEALENLESDNDGKNTQQKSKSKEISETTELYDAMNKDIIVVQNMEKMHLYAWSVGLLVMVLIAIKQGTK